MNKGVQVTFELPEKVRSNIAYTYYNTPNDLICDELMELFGFTLKDGYVYFNDKRYIHRKPSFEITPYIFASEEIEAIEEILNKEYNYAFNASPLLDCVGWIIRKEFDCYKTRYALSSIYEIGSEPMTPWYYDIEDEDLDWRHGDDWEDGLDLEKDLPKHWITKDIMTDIKISCDLENLGNTDWRMNDSSTVELKTSSEEDNTEYLL